MVANRILALMLASLGCGMVMWFGGGSGYDDVVSMRLFVQPSSSNRSTVSEVTYDDLLMRSKDPSAQIQSSLRPRHDNEQRFLLDNVNNNAEGGENHDTSRRLPSPILSNQVWRFGVSNPLLNEGIKKGLHNVGIFFLGWFIFMCVIGVSMRCFLCCEIIWSGRNCNLQRLYNSFCDREPSFENEEEGIALDSLRGRTDNNESDQAENSGSSHADNNESDHESDHV